MKRQSIGNVLALLVAACGNGNFHGNGGDVDAAPGGPPTADARPAAPDATPIPVDDGRVKDGLAAIYKLKGGTGSIVHDTSGALPIDLTIADPANTTWGADGLTITAPTIIKSDGPATKIIDACTASGQITVEAWITPASLVAPAAPARIVGVSVDTANRNFSLLQSGPDYEFRLRTAATDLNGTNPSTLSTGTATTTPQHIVYTRGVGGGASFYIDGTKQPPTVIPQGFATWDPSYQLLLANELTLDRPWLGTIHLVAIYCRELTPAEVTQNHGAGY